MSGGHYDYAYSKINQLATDIQADVIKHSRPYKDGYGYIVEPLPPDILTHMTHLAKLLDQAGEAARDLEWFLSGDYGEDTLRNCPSWKLSETQRKVENV